MLSFLFRKWYVERTNENCLFGRWNVMGGWVADSAFLVDTPVSEFSTIIGFRTSERASEVSPVQGGTISPP